MLSVHRSKFKMLRKAKILDIKQIHSLINQYAKKDLMLPRSMNEIYETMRDFWVYVRNNRVIGCAALHVSWSKLAEIKSLAVGNKYRNRGIGTQLIQVCLKEAKDIGVRQVFVLTYNPQYFRRFGFRRVKNDTLPHKIWAECINCPKFPNCKEVALIKDI